MANNIFQKLLLATAGTVLSLAASNSCPTHAATITHDFTVDVTASSLRGNSYSDFLSYDDTAIGPARFQPYFTFGFAGRTYTQSDLGADCRSVAGCYPLNITGGQTLFNPPSSIGLILQGGTLQSIQFGNAAGPQGFPNSTSQPLFQFSATPTNSFFVYQLPGGTATPGSGSVRYSSRSTPIPEPEDAVYALVVIGFGWFLRKKIAYPKRTCD